MEFSFGSSYSTGLLNTLPDEEELIRLVGFAPLPRITAFTDTKVNLDLHYPTKNLKTPLTAAINRGDVHILESLLDKYPVKLDSTTTQPFGKTALMHASYVTRNSEVLEVLISRGADVHKTDMRGWNCLYYAVVGERIGNVKYLLESSGANVESKDIQGRTPLMIAVILSNLAIAELLLDYGANPRATDKFGYSALRLAILRKKQEQAVLLVKNGSDANCTPSTSVHPDCKLAEYLMPDLSPIPVQKLRYPAEVCAFHKQ